MTLPLLKNCFAFSARILLVSKALLYLFNLLQVINWHDKKKKIKIHLLFCFFTCRDLMNTIKLSPFMELELSLLHFALFEYEYQAHLFKEVTV